MMMDSASGERRSRIRPTQGNLVTFGLLMIAAWISDAGRPDGDWAIEAERSKMLRIQNQTIRFDVFGLDIRPSGDWTFLQPIQEEKELRLVFVNARDNLIATLRPVEFKSWPPESSNNESIDNQGEREVSLEFGLPRVNQSVTDLLQLPKVSETWTPEQFGDLVIDWFEYRDVGYASHRYGRIKTKRHELLLNLIAHPDCKRERVETALQPLLESMQLLE
jgi:hypothetical protein